MLGRLMPMQEIVVEPSGSHILSARWKYCTLTLVRPLGLNLDAASVVH